jgi:hypothetical protein
MSAKEAEAALGHGNTAETTVLLEEMCEDLAKN